MASKPSVFWRKAYIGLGSNLADPRRQLVQALAALAVVPGTRGLVASRFYRTPPWGLLDQPDFINAVARLETTLEPPAMLAALQTIEQVAGRSRHGERWGPRLLDLDLLHMDGVQIASDPLTLPHPRLAERAFVLLPLHELAPDLQLPGLGQITRLLMQADTSGCVVVI